jgi:type II secretory pathway predicted ATPase ExeA
MFEKHFGLTCNPFAISPDAAFFFPTARQRDALDMIDLAVSQGVLITVISGEIGCGKTILTRALTERLAKSHRVGLLSNAYPGLKPVMRWAAGAFGLEVNGKDELECLGLLEGLAVKQAAAGRPLLLIIDEAQNLGIETLESVRTLTNMGFGKRPLLQLVLLGQPGLMRLLNSPELSQLAQRVGAETELGRMSLAETRAFIDHRLKVAGATTAVFDEFAASAVHHYASGVPRIVNRLCERAMIYAYGAGVRDISLETVIEVAQDQGELQRGGAVA